MSYYIGDDFVISIHALRREGDQMYWLTVMLHINFNPRPPQGGRQADLFNITEKFQISIHALRREGDLQFKKSFLLYWMISIHALRREGDFIDNKICTEFCYFNPRPPQGGRRQCSLASLGVSEISIHALRREGDFQLFLA